MNVTNKKVKPKPKKSKGKLFDKLLYAIIILILLIGVGLISYPTVSNLYNQSHQSHAIASHNRTVEQLDETVKNEILAAANAYNEQLPYNAERFLPSESDMIFYNALLDPSDNGIMGYINIKKIDVHLAIYHGTEEKVLQTGVGHIVGSSLPVGGESTHALLSGHRGLPSSTLFTHLDELTIGDKFTLHILGDVLTYEVDDIQTVLPEELNSLEIYPGEDLVTLVTCTPYGINSHRLLVRGKRVPTTVEDIVEDDSIIPSTIDIAGKSVDSWMILIIIAAIAIIIIEALRRKSKNN